MEQSGSTEVEKEVVEDKLMVATGVQDKFVSDGGGTSRVEEQETQVQQNWEQNDLKELKDVTELLVEEKSCLNPEAEQESMKAEVDQGAKNANGGISVKEQTSDEFRKVSVDSPDKKSTSEPSLEVAEEFLDASLRLSGTMEALPIPHSGLIPLSGPIHRPSQSGPIPFSGNLSLRSDSSTTSTRSFAFPILTFDWNSSPVKMAPPDKRYSRSRSCCYRWLCCCFCPSTQH